MNGREFVRRARRYARRNGLEWYFDPARGKGSHGTFYLEDRETIVQHGEIGPGLLLDMLRDLARIHRRETVAAVRGGMRDQRAGGDLMPMKWTMWGVDAGPKRC